MLRRTVHAGLLASAALAVGSGPAAAFSVNFGCISDNSAQNCATGEDQLSLEVTAGATGLVNFAFSNSGPNASSLRAVYFEDQTSTLLDGMDSILDGSGVDFDFDADPFDLPFSDDADPDFEASFSAGAVSPVSVNGVDPGENLTILAELAPGSTFEAIEAAILGGSLRVGLFAAGFGSQNGNSSATSSNGKHSKHSKKQHKAMFGADGEFDHKDCKDHKHKEKGESFVNDVSVVPEPGLALLLVAPLLALVGRARQR